MNGARTEVWANTSSAPSRSKNSTSGASHHFLRARRNAQTSRTRLACFIGQAPSKETLHVTAAAGTRLPRDPEARLRGQAPERVPPREAQQQPHRCDHAEVCNAEKDGRCDLGQRGGHPHPSPLQRPEAGRRDEPSQAEQGSQGRGYGRGRVVPAPPERARQGHERGADGQAEPASLGGAQSSRNSPFQSSVSFHSGCCALSSRNGPKTR